jgi:[ribosomal protein S18]-alanine N-acetyltransferase
VKDLSIRRLTYADLPEVVAIERRAFHAPWSLAMFVLELSRPGGICLVATVPAERRDPQLAGYLVCSRYDTVWHLMDLAVDPRLRRRGIAAALMHALLEALPSAQEQVTLEVRHSNDAAIALYEGLGFRVAGVRRRYYQDNGEDALIMWRTPATLRGSLDDVPAADPRAAVR